MSFESDNREVIRGWIEAESIPETHRTPAQSRAAGTPIIIGSAVGDSFLPDDAARLLAEEGWSGPVRFALVGAMGKDLDLSPLGEDIVYMAAGGKTLSGCSHHGRLTIEFEPESGTSTRSRREGEMGFGSNVYEPYSTSLDFKRCDFSDAEIVTSGRRIYFSDCNFSGARLSGEFKFGGFTRCDLRGASFSGRFDYMQMERNVVQGVTCALRDDMGYPVAIR
jgi:hypothetical protein